MKAGFISYGLIGLISYSLCRFGLGYIEDLHDDIRFIATIGGAMVLSFALVYGLQKARLLHPSDTKK